MSEGPRAGEPDHDDGATPPAEPGAAEPTQPPRLEPGAAEPTQPPRLEPGRPATPPWERPIFVVAAPQPAPEDADEGPLFIVPAAQPVFTEPAPVAEHAQPSVTEPAPVVEPAPVDSTPSPVAPAWSRSPQPEAAWEEPQPTRRRWRPGCFTILLVLLAALIGGGIYAYQTRLVTPRLVLDAVGFGAAEVEFLNLRDDAIRADLAPGSQADAVPAGLRLAPYEVRTYRAVRPSRLAVTLVGADGASLGTCTLDLRSGDRFQLVALPDTALVRPMGQTPGSGRDLLFAESGFCR